MDNPLWIPVLNDHLAGDRAPGDQLPLIRTKVPGPKSRERVDVLARHECPAITARRARRASVLGTADDDPILWDQALGSNVLDVDGNRYVDLTSGFGVALVGHRHPAVVAAAHAQTDRLIHAMGDAWPDATRIRLLERLATVTPEGLDVAILGLSGSDAVDAAIKTAILATGRPGVLTFEGGYHGLALGVVALQGYKPAFTAPFSGIAHPRVVQLPYGCDPDLVRRAVKKHAVGLVLAEPIQGRGGVRTPPPGWLAAVADEARLQGAIFALDEIQTGLGRTGAVWSGPDQGIVPDLMCVGKALGGGFPLSACVGSSWVMDAWGASNGEALHTQTFLGHPVGCAAALAVLELVDDGLEVQAATVGTHLTSTLHAAGYEVQGKGAMLGVRIDSSTGRAADRSLALSRALLQRGFLVLPAGIQAEVLCLTPPATITHEQCDAFVAALVDIDR